MSGFDPELPSLRRGRGERAALAALAALSAGVVVLLVLVALSLATGGNGGGASRHRAEAGVAPASASAPGSAATAASASAPASAQSAPAHATTARSHVRRYAPPHAPLRPAGHATYRPPARAAAGRRQGDGPEAVTASVARVRTRARAVRRAAAVTAPLRAPGLEPSAVVAPAGAPPQIAGLVHGGNLIATYPYVWGGGHRSFSADGYDCSGSVSYALASAGLLSAPRVAADFRHWGTAGRGRWLTLYANAHHVFLVVDGVRFDTSFRTGTFGSRWQTWARTTKGFVVRHWPGL